MPNESMTIEIVGDATTMQEGVGTSTPENVVIGPDNNYYQLPSGATPQHLGDFLKRMGGFAQAATENAVAAATPSPETRQTFEDVGKAVLDPVFYGYLLEEGKKWGSEPENALGAAALATNSIWPVGDILGGAADAVTYYKHPEERNWLNFGLTGFGLLPFIPPMFGIIRHEKGPMGGVVLPGGFERKVNDWIGYSPKSEMFSEEMDPITGAPELPSAPTYFEHVIKSTRGEDVDQSVLDKVKEWSHSAYKKYLYERLGTAKDEIREFIDSGKGEQLTSALNIGTENLLTRSAAAAASELKLSKTSSVGIYNTNKDEYLERILEEKVAKTTKGKIYEEAADAAFSAKSGRVTGPKLDENLVKAERRMGAREGVVYDESIEAEVKRKTQKNLARMIFGDNRPLNTRQKEFLDKYYKTATFWSDTETVWRPGRYATMRGDNRIDVYGIHSEEVPYYVGAKIAEGLYWAVKDGTVKSNQLNKLSVAQALEVSNAALEKRLLKKFESADLIKKNVLEHNKKIGTIKTYPPVKDSPTGTGWYKYTKGMSQEDVRTGLSVDTQGAVRVDKEHVVYGKEAVRAAGEDQKLTGDICVGQCDYDNTERIPMRDLATLEYNKNSRGETDNLYAQGVYIGKHEIYSLRDLDSGQANAVLEIDLEQNKGAVKQAKGPQNGPIQLQYQTQVIDLLNEVREKYNAVIPTSTYDVDNFRGVVVRTKPVPDDAGILGSGWTQVEADPRNIDWEWGHIPTIRQQIKGDVEKIKEIAVSARSMRNDISKLTDFGRKIESQLNKDIIKAGEIPNHEEVKRLVSIKSSTHKIIQDMVSKIEGAMEHVKFYETETPRSFNGYYKLNEKELEKTYKSLEALKEHPMWQKKKPQADLDLLGAEFASRNQQYAALYNRAEVNNVTLAETVARAAHDLLAENDWDNELRFVDVFKSFLRLQMDFPERQAEQLALRVDALDDWYANLDDYVLQYLDGHRDMDRLNPPRVAPQPPGIPPLPPADNLLNIYQRGEVNNDRVANAIAQGVYNRLGEVAIDVPTIEILEPFLRETIGMPENLAEQLSVLMANLNDAQWVMDLEDEIRDFLNQHRNPDLFNIQF